jgi:hypothetical protein
VEEPEEPEEELILGGGEAGRAVSTAHLSLRSLLCRSNSRKQEENEGALYVCVVALGLTLFRVGGTRHKCTKCPDDELPTLKE